MVLFRQISKKRAKGWRKKKEAKNEKIKKKEKKYRFSLVIYFFGT